MITEILDMAHEMAVKHLKTYLSSVGEGKPSREEFQRAKAILYNHISWEETFLFKSVETDRNSPRIHGMEVEHGGIWKLMGKIDNYVENREDELAVDRLDGLMRLLESHHLSESRTIYGSLDNMDTGLQAQLVMLQLSSTSPPDGWLCSILRGRR